MIFCLVSIFLNGVFIILLMCDGIGCVRWIFLLLVMMMNRVLVCVMIFEEICCSFLWCRVMVLGFLGEVEMVVILVWICGFFVSVCVMLRVVDLVLVCSCWIVRVRYILV